MKLMNASILTYEGMSFVTDSSSKPFVQIGLIIHKNSYKNLFATYPTEVSHIILLSNICGNLVNNMKSQCSHYL